MHRQLSVARESKKWPTDLLVGPPCVSSKESPRGRKGSSDGAKGDRMGYDGHISCMASLRLPHLSSTNGMEKWELIWQDKILGHLSVSPIREILRRH